MAKILFILLLAYLAFKFLNFIFKIRIIKNSYTETINRNNRREIDITDRVRILDEEEKKSPEN